MANTIKIYDTTHIVVRDTVQVFDTVLVSVADTLIIDAVLSTGAEQARNTLKVYPNPAHNILYIDNGDYALMDFYSIEITNTMGERVFHEFIDQQIFSIDLSAWPAKGMFFLRLYDNKNNTVAIRKIIVQ